MVQLRPNPSVNRNAPVYVFDLASALAARRLPYSLGVHECRGWR